MHMLGWRDEAVLPARRAQGRRAVIGSSGSDDEVRWLREIGFDAAFNTGKMLVRL
jgi:hypothetical protein